MDVIDIVIQIQKYFPIFDKYSLRLISKVWKDAYYLSIKNDKSDIVHIFNWWKKNGAKDFFHRFDLNFEENVVLGYSDSLFGEIIYNRCNHYLHFISRVFKKYIFLLKWPIYNFENIECFIVNVGDQDKHVLYIGQTSKDKLPSYTMISLDIRKFHHFSNIKMKDFNKRAKKFMFFRSKGIEYFIKSKTFYYIIPWESIYFTTNHTETKNGNIFIKLASIHKRFQIFPGIQLVSVNETKLHQKDLVLLRLKMGGKFFTILVNASYVGFYPKPIFCQDDHLIDSDGNFVESVQVIDKTLSLITILDPTMIQPLIN